MNKLNSKNKKQRLTLRKAKWFTQNQSNGFTIIEVVLVLAIAGLIFLIVFLALPGLQRSRRDTQRKSDVGRMLSTISNYASNNNGTYPASIDGVNFAGASGCTSASPATCIVSSPDQYEDPSGAAYKVVKASSSTTASTITGGDLGLVYYYNGTTALACPGAPSSSPTYTNWIALKLESGPTVYCQGQ